MHNIAFCFVKVCYGSILSRSREFVVLIVQHMMKIPIPHDIVINNGSVPYDILW